MVIKLLSFVILLFLIESAYGACRCGDKMVYFYTELSQQYYLYTYNLTSGEQMEIMKLDGGDSFDTLFYASQNKEKAIFSSLNYLGQDGQNSIVEFDFKDRTLNLLGHSKTPVDYEVCSNNYNRHNNLGYSIVFNSHTGEFGLVTFNYNDSTQSYTKQGYASSCPFVSVPKDFSEFYLIVNTTTAYIIGLQEARITSTYYLVGYSSFINNASIIPIGIVSEYKGSLYGAAYSVVNQTATTLYVYKLDLNSLVFSIISEITELTSINTNFPDAMFSSDGSHLMLMVTLKGVQQLLIYSFEVIKPFYIVPKDPLPNSAVSYYLVYDAPNILVYPEKAMLGVTFGYGIPIIIILGVVVFIMYRDDFSTLIEGARNWAVAKAQRIANIVFFFVGAIKLVVVYVLAAQLNYPGLALTATFMELHKAIFGIYTSLFYRPKLLIVYYILSALSILFHFITFITAFVHVPSVIEVDVGGVRFYKALTFLIFFSSTAYFVYFFIKVRKSDPTSSNDGYRSSVSNRDDISYESILNNNDFEDEDD